MEMYKTDRGLLSYILLSIVTFGIYPFYFTHRVAVELNEGCKEDGKTTAGLLTYLLLSVLTLGIYSLVWAYNCANRMEAFYLRKGQQPQVSGTSFLLWTILGSMLFGIGPFVAMYKFIHSLNDVNYAHNRKN